MPYNIMINTPSLNSKGGVSNFHLSLKGKSTNNIKYCIIGNRRNKSSFFSIGRLMFDYVKFFQYLISKRIDLVHLNPSLGYKSVYRDSIFVLISKIFRKKILVMWHGWDEKVYFSIINNKISRQVFKFTFMKANAFTVLAEKFKNQLLKLGCNKTIYLETALFDDNLVVNYDFNYHFSNSMEYLNVLFLSRIEKEKGIYEVIDTFQILIGLYPNLKLTIAGDGSEIENVKEYTENKSIQNVEFVGYVSKIEKRKVFEEADIFFLPSYNEGMPISLIEAMAFGIPIISRPVGGIPDFFKNEEMGYITHSKNPRVFADLIIKIIADPNTRKRIGRNNILYSHKRFSAKNVARRVDTIYSEILRG